jgi:hypothetical protein
LGCLHSVNVEAAFDGLPDFVKQTLPLAETLHEGIQPLSLPRRIDWGISRDVQAVVDLQCPQLLGNAGAVVRRGCLVGGNFELHGVPLSYWGEVNTKAAFRRTPPSNSLENTCLVLLVILVKKRTLR